MTINSLIKKDADLSDQPRGNLAEEYSKKIFL